PTVLTGALGGGRLGPGVHGLAHLLADGGQPVGRGAQGGGVPLPFELLLELGHGALDLGPGAGGDVVAVLAQELLGLVDELLGLVAGLGGLAALAVLLGVLFGLPHHAV